MSMMFNTPYGRPYPQPHYRGNNYSNNYTPPDNRSVDTNLAISHAARYDANQDGVLDRFEIDLAAKAAERIDQNLAELFHTFNKGGKNQRGLLPDANGNNALDLSELVDLANHDGDYSRLSVADFKKGFPGQTVDGGNNIQHPYGAPQGGGMHEMVLKLMKALMEMLIQPQQQSYQPNDEFPTPEYDNDPFAEIY